MTVDTPTDDDAQDEEPLRHPQTEMLIGHAGEAELTVEIDRATYEYLREEYERCSSEGYPESWDTFVINHCSTETTVTVDGEAVDPDAPDFGPEA
jgi:hypothetical protein